LDHPSDMSALHAGTRQWGHIIEHRRFNEPKQELPAQAPITHPLFGAEPPQHIPLTGPNQYQPYQNQGQQYPGQITGQQFPGQAPGQQYPGQNLGQFPGQTQGQAYPGPGVQYPGQQTSQQMPGQFQEMNQTYRGRASPAATAAAAAAAAATAAAAAAAAPPAPKPIPEQFAPMVNVFDSLRNECYNRADNQQIRRKLEDVQRRLENMYDMLRENKRIYPCSEVLSTSTYLVHVHRITAC
ncbi:hypothetical protein ACJJTC_013358, partial [Scirpophaga incertulas]